MLLELPLEVPKAAIFPDTKYMGSKSRILPFIVEKLSTLQFTTVLDAFSGSGCISFALKKMGKHVFTNDFLNFCYQTAKATVENSSVRLTEADLYLLLRENLRAKTFIRDTYAGLFFTETDCEFLDNLRANIDELNNEHKQALALAAAARACMKKRPRGLFTFTGRKGFDGRKDLKLSMREQFLNAVAAFNDAVFDNGAASRAFNADVFALELPPTDVVYIDSPYISPFSDCDYTRRYHFVEGFCRNWQGVEIMPGTKTKKIRSLETAFGSKATAEGAFRRLFAKFAASVIVVSYSSNSIPSKEQMISLLREVKGRVDLHTAPLKYSHGNHGHKIGDNMNDALEYLFVAQ